MSSYLTTVNSEGDEVYYTYEIPTTGGELTDGWEYRAISFRGNELLVWRMIADVENEMLRTEQIVSMGTVQTMGPETIIAQRLGSTDEEVGVHMVKFVTFGAGVVALGNSNLTETFWYLSPNYGMGPGSGEILFLNTILSERREVMTLDNQSESALHWARSVEAGTEEDPYSELVSPLTDTIHVSIPLATWGRSTPVWHGLISAVSGPSNYSVVPGDQGEDIVLNAHISDDGRLRFSSEYSGGVSPVFFEEAFFAFEYNEDNDKGDGKVHLWRHYGTNGHKIAGDDIGAQLQGATPDNMWSSYQFQSGNVGLVVQNDPPNIFPDGVERPLPDSATISGPGITPNGFVNIFARSQYTFTSVDGVTVETSNYIAPPAAETLTSGWFRGSEGYWSGVTGILRSEQAPIAVGTDNTFSVAVHFVPAGDIRDKGHMSRARFT